MNRADASLLEINDLVTQSKSKLLGLQFPRDIGTGERPIQDGDGTGEHAFHRLLSQALSVAAPFDGHGMRAADVRDDDGRTNIADHIKNQSENIIHTYE